MSTAVSVRKRPPLFRALGRQEPPDEIEVDGQTYRLVEVFKHDSWAATALYDGASGPIVCKFNRVEHLFGVPLDWLGRWLAERERRALTRLAGVAGIPRVCARVHVNGKWQTNAVAHAYVEGHPLAKDEQVDAAFFPALQETLETMHRRGIAYVDLHKRENIIVGDDGRPYLIDFQIHLEEDRSHPLARFFFGLFCRSDLYHFQKHVVHAKGGSDVERPWWIRLHRLIAQPFRQVRRRLLVWLGIRKDQGRVETEHFPEDAVRRAA